MVSCFFCFFGGVAFGALLFNYLGVGGFLVRMIWVLISLWMTSNIQRWMTSIKV